MLALNSRDPRPIYEQVKDGLRKLILSGALQPDEKVPSVRELASNLAINPNTIQRAYRELEQEGFLCSRPGRGSFVSDISEAAGRHIAELLAELDAKIAELLDLGLSRQDLIAHIEKGGKK